MWPSSSVEWSGFLVIDAADTYEFSTLSDDGSELEVADRIVVSNGGLHGPQEARGSIALDAGVHPFKLRYEQAGGGFALAVRYARAGAPLVDIPASRLMPDAMPYTEYRLRRPIRLGGAVLAVLLWIAARLRADATARQAPDATAVSDTTSAAARLAEALARRRAVAIIIIVGLGARILMMLGSDALLWGDSDVFIETFGAIRSGRFLEHDPHARCCTRISSPPS